MLTHRDIEARSCRAACNELASPREVLDEALVRAIASGDRDAMQTLYQRHSVRLHRFVLRLVPDPALAEEIVSEVFLALWQRAGSFRRKSQVST